MRKEINIGLAAKIVLGMGILAGVSGNAIAPCLPDIKLAFQNAPYADFLVKSLFPATGLFAGASSFLIGILLDKWGRKPVIMAAFLLSTAGLIGFFADSLYSVLASRIFVGIGIGGALTGFTTLIGDYFKGSELDKFMGLQNAINLLGSIFFLSIGGILVDINWRLVFLVYGLPFFIVIGIRFFLKEPQVASVSEPGEKAAPLPKALYPIFALAFLSGWATCMVYVYTPFYLKSMAETSGKLISFALTASLISSAIAAMLYQKLRVYLSFQKIIMACFALIAVGFFSTAMAGTYYQVVAGLIIIGLGFGVFMPTINILTVSLVSPSNRGKAVGILDLCLSVGPFVSLIALQLLVDQIGIGKTFLVMSFLPLVSMVIFRNMGKE